MFEIDASTSVKLQIIFKRSRECQPQILENKAKEYGKARGWQCLWRMPGGFIEDHRIQGRMQ